MIAQTLQAKIGEALKAHDEIRLSTLRLLSSAFNYERIAKQHELTDEEELAVIKKEAKQRRDSIEAYKKAGALERSEREGAELKILQEYLPPEINDSDLEKIVMETMSIVNPTSMADMGKVIGMVKNKAPNADGSRIAELVKSKLQV
jgi:uncharacterized protein